MMSLEQRNFYLNKAMYNIQIAPVFKREKFVPKLILQYTFLLPFQLPFPSNNFITHIMNDNEYLTFSFDERSIENPLLIGTFRETTTSTYQTAFTRVEMNYFTSKVIASDDNLLSNTFNKLLEHLNRIIVSYVIKTKDSNVHRLTKEMLPANILCKRITNLDFEKAKEFLFMLHPYVPYIKETLSHEKYLEIQQYQCLLKMIKILLFFQKS